MARTAPKISCDPQQQQTLERLAASRTEPKQAVERARIILGCLAGKRVERIARECHTRPNTVSSGGSKPATCGHFKTSQSEAGES